MFFIISRLKRLANPMNKTLKEFPFTSLHASNTLTLPLLSELDLSQGVRGQLAGTVGGSVVARDFFAACRQKVAFLEGFCQGVVF